MLFLISLGIYGDLVSGNIIGGRGGMRKQGMVLMGIIMENLNLAKPASSAHPAPPPLPFLADDSIMLEIAFPNFFLLLCSSEGRKKG